MVSHGADIVDRKGRHIPVARRRIVRHLADEDTPQSELSLQEELEQLSSRVRRLTVSRKDPDKFFEERSEIAERLQRLGARHARR